MYCDGVREVEVEVGGGEMHQNLLVGAQLLQADQLYLVYQANWREFIWCYGRF